jgi:predicted AlkP superfamily phosphohydrolase/phosphomutase
VVELPPFQGSARTLVFGPRNKLFYQPDPKTRLDPEGDPKDINLELTLRRDAGKLALALPGSQLSLAPGQWSDWLELEFPFNRFLKLKGIARFHLIALEPELKLYLSPVNFHPHRPPFRISSPAGFADELRHRVGFYKTLGWEEDTWSYNQRQTDETVFLSDVEATVSMDEKILQDTLQDPDLDVLVQVFSFTDRVAHVFWRLTDPQHPAFDAALAARYGGEIDRWYERMDAIVGRTLGTLGESPDTLFLVLSDHGFATWRRSVNYNTWLVKNGYLTLFTKLGGKDLTLEDLFGNKSFWPYVDWSKSRAYSLGLGNIYINRKGREPMGIVEDGPEYERLLGELQSGLEALVDPATGLKPVRKVYRREEMYKGFNADIIADLRVANNPGYRVSWQSSLGATPPEVFEDNKKPWSGDHCSLDPEWVPGILFSSRPLGRDDPAIVDVPASVLGFLGIEAPPDLDGRSFL